MIMVNPIIGIFQTVRHYLLFVKDAPKVACGDNEDASAFVCILGCHNKQLGKTAAEKLVS